MTVADHDRELVSMAREIKQALLALPTKISGRLAKRTAAEIKKELTAAAREICRKLAEGEE